MKRNVEDGVRSGRLASFHVWSNLRPELLSAFGSAAIALGKHWLHVRARMSLARSERPRCPPAVRIPILRLSDMARLLLLPMLAVTLPAEASEAPETCATA